MERLGKIGKIRNKTCGGISHTPAGKRGFHNSVSGRKNPFRHWFSHGLSNISYVYWLTGYEGAVNALGTETTAGYTAATKVDQISVLMNAAFGIAISNYVAQNYGASL